MNPKYQASTGEYASADGAYAIPMTRVIPGVTGTVAYNTAAISDDQPYVLSTSIGAKEDFDSRSLLYAQSSKSSLGKFNASMSSTGPTYALPAETGAGLKPSSKGSMHAKPVALRAAAGRKTSVNHGYLDVDAEPEA